VVEIVARVLAGESQHRVAKDFRISQPSVHRIVRGTQWTHVTRGLPGLDQYNPTPGLGKGEDHITAKLTEDDVRAIRQRLSTGEALSSVARDYGVTALNVEKIRDGIYWRNVAPEVTACR
jgi:uncharacterized protein (DUF433 family)